MAAKALEINSNMNEKAQSFLHDERRHVEQFLISPFWDLFLVGGASLFIFLLAHLFFRLDAPDAAVGWFVFNLSYLVNFPHFLVSYQILYFDFRKRIFTDVKFFWAAVLVPLILTGFLASAFVLKTPATLGYAVNAMYFFVGWHYVKQIFGCISVGNVLNGYFYSPLERKVVKANLFSLWGLSYICQNQGARGYQMEGIKYLTFDFPNFMVPAAMGIVAFTGAAVLFLHFRKYLKTGRVPSRLAMGAFVTIYVWYIPAMYHPLFFHMIPLFHSLQYLLFVFSYRRNKATARYENIDPIAYRKGWTYGVIGYLLFAGVLGALAFQIIPKWIDASGWTDPALFGPTVAVFAATIFINIHHYFIDNVIWRGNNPEMKKYLFASEAKLKRAA